jgi:hypothetical protein
MIMPKYVLEMSKETDEAQKELGIEKCTAV